jgi:hypothetical protein
MNSYDPNSVEEFLYCTALVFEEIIEGKNEQG